MSLKLGTRELAAAAEFMQRGASLHWRSGRMRPNRSKCFAVALWMKNHYDAEADRYSSGRDALVKQAKNDKFLQDQCGSIWLLLLGQLLIRLFILWLEQRKETP